MTDKAFAEEDIGLHFAQLTDTGGRPSNQDACGHALQDELACFVVSDGVGGHQGGEIASNIVVQAILGRFRQESSFSARALRSYVEYASARVAQRKTEDAQLKDMSATVAVVLIDQKNRCALWAHMGDTRIYLSRRGTLRQITKDHSLVQQFIDAGYCSVDESRSHPQRSTLYAAIGQEGDTVPEVTPQPLEIEDGDAFLICTDGLWEYLSEDQMERAAATAASAQAWLQEMNVIAEKNGRATPKPRDNYTAYTLSLGRAEATPPQAREGR